VNSVQDLRYQAYRIEVAQELGEQVKANPLQFCIHCLDLVTESQNIVSSLLMSDKTEFHISGYVNKQNCWFWAADDLHELHWRPLHSVKVKEYGVFFLLVALLVPISLRMRRDEL
jgi:hypothetical protein